MALIVLDEELLFEYIDTEMEQIILLDESSEKNSWKK